MDIQELLKGAVLIGKGKQGRVYKLASDRCIKIYSDEQHAQMEYMSYCRAEGSPVIPKLYEAGPNYLIMELVQGASLDRYLKKKGAMTRSDTERILFIIHEMIRLGFTRIDAAVFHIFIDQDQPTGKVIDLVNSYTKQYHIPLVMFKGLSKLNVLNSFLTHVKVLDPELYQIWANYLMARSERYGKLQVFDE
ncbi:kinase [Paenibacillus sp. WQ 127069]|uniref:Kinase n=1 Tax=Paenibacillus baimaensis TaxID=2982185 RepID=A0ABT2UN05_9BACL|nr:kinase [Paenibacillus sp. WQ 127069]MCU6796035.1 kinase [Paenibacillus sp. WQ 127069]